MEQSKSSMLIRTVGGRAPGGEQILSKSFANQPRYRSPNVNKSQELSGIKKLQSYQFQADMQS